MYNVSEDYVAVSPTLWKYYIWVLQCNVKNLC